MKVQAGDAVRLSEKVLSLGIQEFYTSQRLVPIGIGLEAAQAVCDKMALGLRKVVQKFARAYKESPEGAKSKRLQQLKDRLKNVVSSHEVVAGEANPDSLQEVAQHLPDVKPKIDWVALSEKIALKKKQPAPDNAEAKSKDNLPRPVATPLVMQPMRHNRLLSQKPKKKRRPPRRQKRRKQPRVARPRKRPLVQRKRKTWLWYPWRLSRAPSTKLGISTRPG